MPFAILLRLGMPLALAISGIVVWRMSKRENDPHHQKPQWRDDSLDDWRRERDANVEAERAQRASDPELYAGAEREQESTERQQRIGG